MTTLNWQLGVNMREFAYYGTGILPPIPPTHQRDQLNKLREIGVKLVRFYATQKSFSEQEIRNRVEQSLNLLNEFGMRAIICLTDAVTENGYYVPADDPFYKDINHIHKRYWHEQGFLQDHDGHPSYMNFVTSMVTRFKNHPAVMVWELGNEYVIVPRPASHDDSEAFLNFVKSASRKIKAIAPNHLVSVGLLNTGQVCPDNEDRAAYATRLYGIPSVNLVSLHFYREDHEEDKAPLDAQIARDVVHKPFYVGELGGDFGAGGDRTSYFEERIRDWRHNGAFSVMPWSFNVSPFDMGISDIRGMGAKYSDFDSLVNVLKAQAPNLHGLLQGMPQPSDDFTVEPCDASGRVNTDDVLIRRRPGVAEKPKPIGKVKAGTVLTITGKTTVSRKPREWYRTHYKNMEAYIAKEYVDILAPLTLTQSEDSTILPVPWYSQVDGLFSQKLYEACGPTSVLMVLSAYNRTNITDVSQMTQYHVAQNRLLKLDQTTGVSELKYLAQDAGQLTLVSPHVLAGDFANSVRDFLAENKPVIMLLDYLKIKAQPFKGNRHWKAGRPQEIHWWVVVGTDGDQFVINDPLWQQRENENGGTNLRISEADLCAAYYHETLLVPDIGITAS